MPNTETPWSMIEGVVKASKDKIRAAMEAVGDELLHELKVEVSTPCPNYPNRKRGVPHSAPYNYPFEESGEFRGNLYTRVVEHGSSIVLQLWSQTKRGHGKFLNEGTPRMKPRPYGELILLKKDWIARISQVARSLGGQE